MGTLSNSFEGGTNGTTISTANSGGTSGDAFGAVVVDSTLTYTTASAAHGSVAALASGTSDAYVAWTSGLAGTSATVYARAYFRFASLPASNTNILRLLSSSNGIMGTIRINTTGTLGMLWGTGSLGGTTTGSVTLGAWFRVEVQVIAGGASNGTMVMRVYWTPDATTPDQTITSTGVTTGAANPTRLRCGILSNSAEVYFDDIALSDVDWIGPAGGGGGGVSGTLAATLPHLTGAAALGQQDAGSLTATLPHLTASIASSGTQSGTLTASLPHLAAASSIALKDAGTAAATLPHLAASAAVSQTDSGALAASLPRLGAATTASETDPASLAATLPRLAAAFGTGTPPDTAALAATLPALAAGAAVAQTDQATATAALPHLSAQAAAGLTDGATAALTLPSLVVDLRSSTPATDGTLAATLPALVISLGEEETISGHVAASLPTLRASIGSAASETAVLAAALPSLRAAVSDAPLVVDELPDLTVSIAPTGRLAAAVTAPGHLTASVAHAGRLAATVQ